MVGKEKKEKEEGNKGNNSKGMIVLGRCFSCHKAYILKLMVPFELAEPYEEGMRRCKRYLCPECGERLKQFSWVKEQEEEKKKTKKEVKKENEKSNTD